MQSRMMGDASTSKTPATPMSTMALARPYVDLRVDRSGTGSITTSETIFLLPLRLGSGSASMDVTRKTSIVFARHPRNQTLSGQQDDRTGLDIKGMPRQSTDRRDVTLLQSRPPTFRHP